MQILATVKETFKAVSIQFLYELEKHIFCGTRVRRKRRCHKAQQPGPKKTTIKLQSHHFILHNAFL